MAAYSRPASLADALAALAPGQASPGLVVVAGGTDHYPALVGRPPAAAILDISGIAELAGIARSDAAWRIGATTRWADILQQPGLPPAFDALRAAARGLGGVQIRNAGTLGGNLCTAAATADGIPPLLAADALVELQDLTGSRRVPLSQFIAGDRRTGLRPGELMTAILVPHRDRQEVQTHSAFCKLAARRQLATSIAMLAVALQVTAGRVSAAGIAVGGCSPMACRLPALEARLLQRPLSADLADLVTAADLAPLTPVDDDCAPAAYRLAAVPVLLRRLLQDLAVQSGAAAAAGECR